MTGGKRLRYEVFECICTASKEWIRPLNGHNKDEEIWVVGAPFYRVVRIRSADSNSAAQIDAPEIVSEPQLVSRWDLQFSGHKGRSAGKSARTVRATDRLVTQAGYGEFAGKEVPQRPMALIVCFESLVDSARQELRLAHGHLLDISNQRGANWRRTRNKLVANLTRWLVLLDAANTLSLQVPLTLAPGEAVFFESGSSGFRKALLDVVPQIERASEILSAQVSSDNERYHFFVEAGLEIIIIIILLMEIFELAK